ncbi:hypothetical protein CALVIDRAFT_558342 [Calocera viscosa TUFC12733]|uniref:Uncharacterized protein n=1 Tax=Calocera viscosa (strain TUFC12733) TaxID=1330018 RepID=A0A167GZJ0_CALVF|nr:hypothetical protein CALVIDRAFT_558342 [Calocera viscosa TUFC12733]
MLTTRKGTCIFFQLKHVPIDPSGWLVFMCSSTYNSSIVFAEDLPTGFSGTSPNALEIAKALRIVIDGDLANGKHHKLRCPPQCDPDTEFFFATDSRELCKTVGEAMSALPHTRSSTHEVSYMPHYHTLVPFNSVWTMFLAGMRERAENGTAWRQMLRSFIYCSGTPPKIESANLIDL